MAWQAGRFTVRLIRRQPGLRLHGIVARDPLVRAAGAGALGRGVRGYADLDEALADPAVELVVIATPTTPTPIWPCGRSMRPSIAWSTR